MILTSFASEYVEAELDCANHTLELVLIMAFVVH